MTREEHKKKAEGIVEQFKSKFFQEPPEMVMIKSKECGLIVVTEILKNVKRTDMVVIIDWGKVKEEIRKL